MTKYYCDDCEKEMILEENPIDLLPKVSNLLEILKDGMRVLNIHTSKNNEIITKLLGDEFVLQRILRLEKEAGDIRQEWSEKLRLLNIAERDFRNNYENTVRDFAEFKKEVRGIKGENNEPKKKRK